MSEDKDLKETGTMRQDLSNRINFATSLHSLLLECPNCSFPLKTTDASSTVKCPQCGGMLNVSAPVAEVDYSEKVAGIKTVSAAKAHIEFVFETYDWDAFSKRADDFSIPEIDALIANMKTNQGDDVETWKLSFDYLNMCLTQKINNIDKNTEEIVKNFIDGYDKSSCFNRYDTLVEGIKILKSRSPQILKEMKTCVTYAEKFGMEKDKAAELNDIVDKLSGEIDAIAVPDGLDKHPRVAEEEQRRLDVVREKYKEDGIDAEAVYSEAINSYESGDMGTAADKFTLIPDYLDSQNYLSRICVPKIVGGPKYGQYYYIGNKLFARYDNTLCCTKKKMVDCQNPQTRQAFKQMCCYGNKYYYTDSEYPSSVFYMETDKPQMTRPKFLFFKAKLPEYHRLAAYGKLEYVEQMQAHPDIALVIAGYSPTNQIEDKKEFCKRNEVKIKAVISKKAKIEKCYDLFALNLKTSKFELLIENVKEVVKIVDNNIYYIAPVPEYNKKSEIIDFKSTALYSYNFKSKDIKQLITRDSYINAIDENNNIIFTRNDHGKSNKTIYVKSNDDETAERVLVNNAYDFFGILNGKVYYYVGNKNIRSLCSINVDGSNYLEVMKYMEDVVFTSGDWFYVTRGDRNSDYKTLYRVSINGGQLQRIAFGVYKNDLKPENLFVKEGYLYYTDYKWQLCRVRLDGTGYQDMVRDAPAIMLISNNKVFYLANDGKDDNGYIFSLYDMDMDGSNRRKLIHNLKDIIKLDDKTLMFIRDEKLESKRELYEDIDDEKLNKLIGKIYKKYDKKKKYPSSTFSTVATFDCEEGCVDKVLAYYIDYPTKKHLKEEKQEVLNG